MAASLNCATIIGNVGKDPEVRTTQSGLKIVNLAIATSESWKDKATGERKEKTEWHRIVVMNPHLAGVIEANVHKGSKIYIEGKLQTRKWTDQAGNDKYTTEIMLGQYDGKLLLLDPKNTAPGASASTAPRQAAPAAQREAGWDDEEIPF